MIEKDAAKFLKEMQAKVQEFKLKFKGSPVNHENVEKHYNELIGVIGVSGFPVDKREGWEQWFFRARIGRGTRPSGNMKKGEEEFVKSFYMPPNDCVGWGRANLPKHRVFYGASDFNVALNEVKPKDCEEVFVSVWRSDEFYPKYIQFTLSEDIQNETIKLAMLDKINSLKMTLQNAKKEGLDSIPASFLLAGSQILSNSFLIDDWTVSSLISHHYLYNKNYDGIEYLDVKTKSSVNYALSPNAAENLTLYRVYAIQRFGNKIKFNRIGEPDGDRIKWRPMTEADKLENDSGSPSSANY